MGKWVVEKRKGTVGQTVVPKQGGMGYISPNISDFCNFRSKIPSEGLKNPKINQNCESSPPNVGHGSAPLGTDVVNKKYNSG